MRKISTKGRWALFNYFGNLSIVEIPQFTGFSKGLSGSTLEDF